MVMPIAIFAFYQWTLKDSWLAIVFSVLLALLIGTYIIHVAITILKLARRDGTYVLYTDTSRLMPLGPLYAQYREPRYYFSMPLVVAIVLKAVIVAFAKANGELQVILLIVLECCVLAACLFLRPCQTRGADILTTYLSITRFVCAGLMVAFIEKLALAAIPRVVIGIIIAVLFSISVVVMSVIVIVNLPGFNQLFGRRRRVQQDSTIQSIIEKDGVSPSSTESQVDFGGLRNLTPEHDIQLDQGTKEPYFVDDPTTSNSESPNLSADASSAHMGSSRWSSRYPHSAPYSPSRYSASVHSSYVSSVPSTPRASAPSSPYTAYAHNRQNITENY